MFRKPKGIGTCPRNATAKDEGNAADGRFSTVYPATLRISAPSADSFFSICW
jgi:hypothetical protein